MTVFFKRKLRDAPEPEKTAETNREIIERHPEMRGKRATQTELQQIETWNQEGLTDGEIAEKLGRSQAAIWNLRSRKQLKTKAKDDTKTLIQQRDALIIEVKALQTQKTTLIHEIEILKKGKNYCSTCDNHFRFLHLLK